MRSPEKKVVKEICIRDNNGNNHRNWCSDLPMDALLLIMSKVGAIYILKDVQWVCKNWRKVCREVPSLWRNIVMTSLDCERDDIDLNRMAREAIDRAHGEVQQFDICYFGDDELLQYLADSTSLVRRLRLISAYDISEFGWVGVAYSVTEEVLAESVCRFPLLEEIDIIAASYGDKVIELVGTACPYLKCFRYNRSGFRRNTRMEGAEEGNEEALDIANYMSNLRHLQIVWNSLTKIGLMEILDKCVHLESLDLRCCFRINMNATLRAKCAHIKDLRLPNDPTDDYGFSAELDENPYTCDNYYNSSDYDESQFDSFM